MADDDLDDVAGNDRAGAIGVGVAGRFVRAAEWRTGRHSESASLVHVHAILGCRECIDSLRCACRRFDDGAAAARVDVRQRHWTRDALAGLCGDRAGARAASGAVDGNRAERHRDEHFAHRRTGYRRCIDRESGHRLRVSLECGALAGRRFRHHALAIGAEGKRVARRAVSRCDARGISVCRAVADDACGAAAHCDLFPAVDRIAGFAAAGCEAHARWRRLGLYVVAGVAGVRRNRHRRVFATLARTDHARSVAARRHAAASVRDGGGRLRTQCVEPRCRR